MGTSAYVPNSSAATDTLGGGANTTDYSQAQNTALAGLQQNQGNATGAQQSSLAQDVLDQAHGKGVNLGQTQLQQGLQQTQAATASNIASQRGQNAGTGARLALQTSANQAQTEAGQAALERQQQQLAAQQQVSGMLQGQRGLDIYQQGANAQTVGTIGGVQNNQNLAALGASQQVQNANEFNANTNQKAIGAGASAAGAGASSGLAMTNPSPQSPDKPSPAFAHGGVASPPDNLARGGFARLVQKLNKRPGVHDPAALAASIGRKKYGADKFNAMAHKADGGDTIDFRGGGHVPGVAKVSGDSYANDTVPAMLSPEEIVIPRHISTGPNPAADAAKFVGDIIAKRKGRMAVGGAVPAAPRTPAPMSAYGNLLAKRRAAKAVGSKR